MITNKLKLDLQKPGTTPTVHAVQNDSYSRNLEIALFSGHRPFAFPDGGTVVVRYKKADGKGGEYDTLPDGSAAWWVERNILTVALAPQVLTTPGSVLLSVTLIACETQISVFPIRLSVEPIAAGKTAKSEDYFYITGLLPAPESGKTGQYLRIAAVNEHGRITALEAAEAAAGTVPQKGIDYWTETDRESIVQDVLAALGTPVFGTVDEENNIILTGILPEGTYVLKYEDGEGNLTEIGTLQHSNGEDPGDTGTYTNLADPDSEEWLAGYRIKSDGITIAEASDNTYTTNVIPCKVGDIVRVKGLNIAFFGDPGTTGGRQGRVHFYGEDKSTFIANTNVMENVDGASVPSNGWINQSAEAYWEHEVGSGNYTTVASDISNIRYVRFNGILYDGYTENDVIITVNQAIT